MSCLLSQPTRGGKQEHTFHIKSVDVLPAVPADQGWEADDEADAPHPQDHQLGPAQEQNNVIELK